MSHIATVKTEIKNLGDLKAACKRLGLPEPQHGTHRLFGNSVTGYGVQLPGWRYPVVCTFENGETRYDNYRGLWGKIEELHKLQQAYAVSAAIRSAQEQGMYDFTETRLEDGSIQLICQ